jgi:predicted ATP-grasp superfamily ATP-dependent carboligase
MTVTAASTPPAVLLGGTANALSVARSLRAAGVRVHALGNGGSPVRHSRACAVFVDLGREEGVQERWLAWLQHAGPRGAVVLPCDDDGLELVVRNRRRLSALGYVLIEADDGVVLDMLDKNRTYALAGELGIPAPQTFTVRTPGDVEAVADRVAYPCALKPVQSHRFQRRTGSGRKAYVVHDAAELRARFAETLELGVEMLVTEIIPGGDDQVFGYHSYLDEHGEPLFGLTKRKLRSYPIQFGLGCYHETTVDPELAELGQAFMQKVGVRGLANVEFKRDARDGRLKLIECNHRFTAPNEQFRIAGIDIALFTYCRLAGRPMPRVDRYRAGVRLWHPGTDARAFLALRRRGELSLAGWLRSVARPQHFPLFRWDDPQPSLGLHAVRARRLVRKGVIRRLGAPPVPAAALAPAAVPGEAPAARLVELPAAAAIGVVPALATADDRAA